MPQIVYYFSSALALGAPDTKVAFSVPTGNFGNVFAGYVAAQMGLPIERLIVASNQNDILTRFFESGTMQREAVAPSHSPSMDIQVSSNFERLLFELLGRDGNAVNRAMATFATTGRFEVDASVLEKAHNMFAGYRLDDAATIAEIRHSEKQDNMVLDPHSAVGVGAARMALADGTIPAGVPVISLACAHPAKFQDAVASATGETPALPEHLSDLMLRSEKQLFADATPDAVKALVLQEKRSV